MNQMAKSVQYSFQRVVGGLLCAAAVLSMFSSFTVQAISADEYNSKKASIQKSITDLQSTLNFLTEDYHALPNGTLQDRVDRLNADMAKAQGVTKIAQQAVSDIDVTMQTNREKISAMEEEMKSLVRSIQQQQTSSPIEFIFTSQDIGQLLSRINQYNELGERSRQLKVQLLEENQKLLQARVLREQAVKDAQSAEYIIASRQSTLKDLIDKTGGSEAKFQEIMAQMRADQRVQQAELARLDKAWLGANQGVIGSQGGGPCRFSEGNGLDVGKEFFVTPAIGSRSRGVLCNYHDGIDIANAAGTQVLAAADGVVVKTSTGTYGGGFGNYIIIRHVTPGGRRFYTLYAHLQNGGVLVTTGQTVSKGQHIGGMGTTGNSTGNHLHFMMISDSYETGGAGCAYGSARCYNPDVYIDW